jgi:hypothetical protein
VFLKSPSRVLAGAEAAELAVLVERQAVVAVAAEWDEAFCLFPRIRHTFYEWERLDR